MNESPLIDQGTVWYLPEMQNLRLMRARYVRHAFKPHAHEYFVLGIIEKGLQTFTYQRELLVTAPGDLIIINPGEIHTGESAVPGGFLYRALYPSRHLMDAIVQEFGARHSQIPTFSQESHEIGSYSVGFSDCTSAASIPSIHWKLKKTSRSFWSISSSVTPVGTSP